MNFEDGYALLIGTGSDERILNATVGDAKGIQKILHDNAQYPKDQVRLLTEKEATLDNIKEGFSWLAEQCEIDGGKGKTAIILYSGHGRNANDFVNEFFLEPYGMKPDGTGALLKSTFIKQVNRILADRVVIILSCCHAAQLGVALGESTGEEDNYFLDETAMFISQLEKGLGRIIISSSHASQESFAESKESQTTIFGGVLIEAMRGKAARLSDQAVSALQIADYVLKTVEKKVREIGRSQNPILRIPHMESAVFLTKNEFYDSDVQSQNLSKEERQQKEAELNLAIEEKKAILSDLEKQMKQAASLNEKYTISSQYVQEKRLYKDLTFDKQKYIQQLTSITKSNKRKMVKTLLRKRMIMLKSQKKGRFSIEQEYDLDENTEKLTRFGINVDTLGPLNLSSIEAIIKNI